jgi:flagella basal body P-ring formation protein FlgA
MICLKTTASIAILAALAAVANPGPGIGTVEIELKERSSVRYSSVTIGDVAVLKGGSDELRERMMRVDLADVPPAGQTLSIKSRQVEFRLILADFPANSFRITGGAEVIVTGARAALSAEAVERAAREALVRMLQRPMEDVSITLAEPIALDLAQIADLEAPLVKAEPHSPSNGLGRAQIDVSIYAHGERRLSFPVYFDAKLQQRVAVCRAALKQGETLTQQNIYADRRPVDTANGTVALYDSVLGKKAIRAMPAGQVIGNLDVEVGTTANDTSVAIRPRAATTVNDASFVIRPRQAVKMVLRVGSTSITATGEAMQEGRIGETILVKDVDSKKIMAGRITGPDAVEVILEGNP